MERDGRDHEVPGGIDADRLWSTTAARKDTSKGLLVEMSGPSEVGDDPGETAPLRDVPQELGSPGVELPV
jgi:hypothetical protein